MDNHAAIEQAKEHFGKIIEDQLLRIENMKNEGDFVDYQNRDEIVIGVVGGDGIGPFITKEAEKVLAHIKKFTLENFPEYSDIIEYQMKKMQSGNSYAEMVSRRFGSDYMKKGLELAKEYQRSVGYV